MDTAVRFNILRSRIDGFSSLCVQRSAKSASRKITGGNVAGTIPTVVHVLCSRRAEDIGGNRSMCLETLIRRVK